MSKLNDEVADGPSEAVDKNTLARSQPAKVEKHRPGRCGDDRHLAGFDEAKSYWFARPQRAAQSFGVPACSSPSRQR
jgi:hypothetical protein